VSHEAEKINLIMGLRRRGISNQAVLEAVEKVPRHLFVPEPYILQAYDDNALPIDCGQTISQPLVVATMTQALEVDDTCKVLEIGTGSGYQASVLSHLARRVYTVERYRTLHAQAAARFEALKLTNITAMVGDGCLGWPDQAPFDRIIVTAAAPEIPEKLVDQLKIGGILILPLGNDSGVQQLVTLIREEGGIERKTLMDVRFVPLVEGVAKEL